MALVIPKTMKDDIFPSKIIPTKEVVSDFIRNGASALSIRKYPKQTGYTNGATVIVVDHAFTKFAIECGGKGAMTSAMIMNEFSSQGMSEAIATKLATEYANAYDNYVCIPDGALLIITMEPYSSITELYVPEPVESPEV